MKKKQMKEKLIERIIIDLTGNKIPVPIVLIANKLGVRIWTSKQLTTNVSGMIVRDKKNGGRSGYAIVVNENHSLMRRRFTIAHQLGHYILHRDELFDGIIDDNLYRSRLPIRYEDEAREFADNVLMPLQIIKKLQDSGVTKLEDIAERLLVHPLKLAVHLGIPASVFDTDNSKRENVMNI